MIKITNEDNIKLMSQYPDKFFDLAIVDPPYGILNKTKRGGDRKFNMDEYSKWDVKPDEKYFKELKAAEKRMKIKMKRVLIGLILLVGIGVHWHGQVVRGVDTTLSAEVQYKYYFAEGLRAKMLGNSEQAILFFQQCLPDH